MAVVVEDEQRLRPLLLRYQFLLPQLLQVDAIVAVVAIDHAWHGGPNCLALFGKAQIGLIHAADAFEMEIVFRARKQIGLNWRHSFVPVAPHFDSDQVDHWEIV
jgi:hypothetical protein